MTARDPGVTRTHAERLEANRDRAVRGPLRCDGCDEDALVGLIRQGRMTQPFNPACEHALCLACADNDYCVACLTAPAAMVALSKAPGRPWGAR